MTEEEDNLTVTGEPFDRSQERFSKPGRRSKAGAVCTLSVQWLWHV